MRLEKLEMVGFKSFVERTILKFEPGITAIVGPNGSGKSNIFDAIKWVLGEQSAKEMRGSKMEDVIFNGTDTRPPLGMAEVSLTFSNEDKRLPIEEKEVVITRRIFRSGENEYLINHNPVRLKDIQDLLMGTGVGIDAYSLVGQGKIELILSSKPEERRIIFDEASGILKYKLQKKEATRKLQETENNLLRINDIIAEVKRQIGSLERQANKARRYKELFEELKRKEKDLAIFKIHNLNTEKEKLVSELDQYIKLNKELNETYEKNVLESDCSEKELKEINKEIFQLREKIINIEHTLERNHTQQRLIKERIQEIIRQKEVLLSEIEELKKKTVYIRGQIDNFSQEYHRLKALYEEKTSLIQQKDAKLSELLEAKEQSRLNIEEAKRNILELNTYRTKIRNEITELNTRLKVMEARHRRLNLEKIKCEEEKNVIQKDLFEIKNKIFDLENTLGQNQKKKVELKSCLERETKDIEELKDKIEKLERERIVLLSQKDFLENLNLNYEKMGRSINTVVLLQDLPEDDFNGLVVRVKEKLECNSIDKKIFQEANFKLYAEAKTIDLDAEKISGKIKEIEDIILNKNQIIEEKNQNIEKLNLEIDSIDQQIHQIEIRLSETRNQFNNIDTQFKKIEEELKITLYELSEVISEINTLKGKESLLLKEDKDVELSLQQQDELLHRENENVAFFDREREKYLLEITQLRGEQVSLEEALQGQSQTVEVLNNNLKDTLERIKICENQILEAEKKIERFNYDLEELSLSNNKLNEEKTDMVRSLEMYNIKFQEKQQKLIELKKGIEDCRIKNQQVSNKINEIRMTIQDLDFKIFNIKERIRQLYQLEIKEEEFDLFQEFNEEVALSEIDVLKGKIDSLGTVNMVAIEEYDELKKRYDFLNQQQEDLIKAKESLYEAIQKINRTAKTMFMDTFRLISEEFKTYFRLLFGGGEANLFLLEDSDPLESGVEIVARPPGKKLQNISLLSGGEKSLCAIALIFAIFKVKPSPFCILDEVDAALDEANISRYTSLLDEFSQNSQFIVITHNKRTLLNADVMYGITMQESGVSKIVSVKFKNSKDTLPQTQEVEVPV